MEKPPLVPGRLGLGSADQGFGWWVQGPPVRGSGFEGLRCWGFRGLGFGVWGLGQRP